MRCASSSDAGPPPGWTPLSFRVARARCNAFSQWGVQFPNLVYFGACSVFAGRACRKFVRDFLAASGCRGIVGYTTDIDWLDSMVIPKAAQNVELAHAFINYLLDPAVAALNAQKVNYATPNAAARELLSVKMLADESIYPPAELLDRCAWLRDRGADIEKIERVWRIVRA